MFAPNFRITGKVAKALMVIEADRQLVATLPLTAPILDSLPPLLSLESRL